MIFQPGASWSVPVCRYNATGINDYSRLPFSEVAAGFLFLWSCLYFPYCSLRQKSRCSGAFPLLPCHFSITAIILCVDLTLSLSRGNKSSYGNSCEQVRPFKKRLLKRATMEQDIQNNLVWAPPADAECSLESRRHEEERRGQGQDSAKGRG